MRILISLLFCFALFGESAAENVAGKAVEQQENKTLLRILDNARLAQTKLQAKQDCVAELKAVIDAGKTVEAARLKTATEFAKQQAGLEERKAAKAALDALETQRKAVVVRFNELIRLIDQVEKNHKTALLPEKLNELIVFLEPAASTDAKDEAAKAPPKPLSRGAAPKPQATPTGK